MLAVQRLNLTERTVICLRRTAGYAFAAIITAVSVFPHSSGAEEYVIPSGECIGVKMYTNGLIVTGITDVSCDDGKKICPADGAGIKPGDIITAVNGETAVSNEMLSETVNDSVGDVTLTVISDGEEHSVSLTPAQTSDGRKLGLWLRDSTAGLGTLTYTTGTAFAALGHAICDVDTGNIMPIGRGIIQNCTITSITKGADGAPGAVSGDISGEVIGRIEENSSCGLFGTLSTPVDGKAVAVADPSEVRTGDATILADTDGTGVKEYSIKIKRVASPSANGKDLVIEVTDSDLLEKTGGIVQGMSGAPILQNGKFIGAVTHVFVNDSSSGYGIHAKSMLSHN